MSIYIDNAATTKVRQEVLDAMLPYFSESYGNPSSIYSLAKGNKDAIQRARVNVGKIIGAQENEIYFTGCGTESDNWALIGAAMANIKKGKHVITTKIEHHAVLHTCEFLEKQGFDVTYLDVDEGGYIKLGEFEKALRNDTTIVSIMFANNEIGTIQPIREIGVICRKRGVLFHTDAVQAFGHIPINVVDMNIDLLSASAHKIYGPKGCGLLYIRKGVKLETFMHGGAQERGKRAGTENVAGIVGFGKAAELALSEMEEESKRVENLRNRLIDGILLSVPYSRLNGGRSARLPGNANISFEFIEGESLLLMLDMKGICASSGSACTSGSLDPSHVLLSIGLPHEKAHGSLRMTLGRYNTEAEVDEIIAAVAPIVKRLREMSPLYEDFVKGNKTI